VSTPRPHCPICSGSGIDPDNGAPCLCLEGPVCARCVQPCRGPVFTSGAGEELCAACMFESDND
jgi:hypothetical protein